MGKVKKAIAAGFAAGVTAVLGGFTFTGAPTLDQVGGLIGLFFGGFIVGAVTVYRAPANEVA